MNVVVLNFFINASEPFSIQRGMIKQQKTPMKLKSRSWEVKFEFTSDLL